MRRKLLYALIALCTLGAIFFAGLFIWQSIPTHETVKSIHVSKPTLIMPTTTPTPYSGPVTMTVAATATMKWAPELEPSDFVNVFELVDPSEGFYATGETTYLIAHSFAVGSGAPGNAWEKLIVGDVVNYAGAYYKVDMVSTPAKGAIDSEPVWVNDPDMLVMITCVSRGPGNPATNNYVIRLERIA